MRQREEWKEEMKKKEKEFGEKMKASLEAFYNNRRFIRDEEVLTILRKREAEMEGNMLKKIEASNTFIKSNSRSLGG